MRSLFWILAKIRPKEVVYPHGFTSGEHQLSAETMTILRSESHPDAVLTPQGKMVARKNKKRQAWDPKETVNFFDRVYKQIDTINAEEEDRER